MVIHGYDVSCCADLSNSLDSGSVRRSFNFTSPCTAVLHTSSTFSTSPPGAASAAAANAAAAAAAAAAASASSSSA